MPENEALWPPRAVPRSGLLTGNVWLDGLLALPVGCLVELALFVLVSLAGDAVQKPPETPAKTDLVLALSALLSWGACCLMARRWPVLGGLGALSASLLLAALWGFSAAFSGFPAP